MGTTRTFIALPIPPADRKIILSLIDSLARRGDGVRWSSDDQLHLTLSFLGNVSDAELEQVCAKAQEVAARHVPFDLELTGVGAFPNTRRPSVIWIGVEEGSSEVSLLHEDLDRAFAAMGFRDEQRSFVPHITIGRVKRAAPPTSRTLDLTRWANWSGPLLFVDKAEVMGSNLTRLGPSYSVLATAPLEGKAKSS